MSMRNYIRDVDCDCPEPTPDEQLRASGTRSLVGLFVVNLLALIGIACVLAANAHAATTSADTVTIQLKRGSTIVALVPAPTSLADCETRKAGLIAIAAETKFSGTATYSCIETRRSVVTFSANPPPPPPPTPVDCVVSDWGDWVLGTPSACMSGSQTRTDTRTRTVVTPAANGGAACPALSETVTVTLTCAVEPPPPTIPAVGTITATTVLSPTNPPNYNVALSWAAVAGAESYAIERCTGATCTNFAALATTTTASYANTNLPPSTTYRYRIRGTSGSVLGAWSALRNVTTPTPPPIASAIRINSGGPAVADYLADVHFVGGSTSSNCTRALPGVYATRRFSGSGFEYRIPVVNGSYVVRLLWHECWHTTAGQRVLSASVEGQAIAAFDTWGASGAAITHERTVSVADGVLNIALTAITGDAALNAIEVSASGTQPPPPPATGTAKLTWTPPTTNTDGTALTNLAGYRIDYGTAPGSLTRTVQVPNAGVSTYIVEGLTAGTWYFAARAYTSAGFESANSGVVSRVVQ